MPTLTIDLPETAYRAALALPEAELSRLVARVVEESDEDDDMTLPDYDPPTNAADLAAIGRGLEDLAAGRVIPGEAALAQFRERFRRKPAGSNGANPS